MGRPDPLTAAEAFETVQKLLELRDCISWSIHAKKRARERKFTADDVRRVLTRGTVRPIPEWDDTYQNWKYTFCGRDYDNEPLAVVIALQPQLGRLTLITGEDC